MFDLTTNEWTSKSEPAGMFFGYDRAACGVIKTDNGKHNIYF